MRGGLTVRGEFVFASVDSWFEWVSPLGDGELSGIGPGDGAVPGSVAVARRTLLIGRWQ
ncbi:MAG: hypothetical protein M3P92_02540 [Actinomycetota bacterium]|nr:hypothetical protein [Actinomycetota bacterium]